MNRFRIPKFILASLLGVGLFSCAGCQPGPTQATQAAPAVSAPATLVWWQLGPTPSDKGMVLEQVNEYLRARLNVELDIRYGSYDYSDRMARVINSGESYDMAFTSSWTNPFLSHAAEGAYADLSEVLPKTGKYLLESIPQTLWDAVTMEGKIYGVPVYKDSAFSPYFIFNKNDMDELGLDAQDYSSMDKLEPALAAYKRAHPGDYPLIFTSGEGYHGFFDEFDMLLGNTVPIGVALEDVTATVVNPFESPLIQKKWDLLHSWFQKGYINPDCMTRKEAPAVQFCRGGHGYPYADVIAWSDDYPAVAVQRYDSYITTGSVTGAVNGISVLSSYPEECIAVLNLIDSDAYLRNLLAYGMENVHYEKTGLTTIKRLNERWKVTWLCQGTYFNLYTVDPAPETMWNEVKDQIDSAKSSPVVGFCFDTKPVAYQIAQVQNEFAAYLSMALSGAAARSDLYDEMIAALEQKGLNDIIAEAQRQINYWRASQ